MLTYPRRSIGIVLCNITPAIVTIHERVVGTPRGTYISLGRFVMPVPRLEAERLGRSLLAICARRGAPPDRGVCRRALSPRFRLHGAGAASHRASCGAFR